MTERTIGRAATLGAALLGLLLANRLGAAETAAESLARGDSLYAVARLDASLAHYQHALDLEPANFVVLCRMARAESELGEDASGESQRQLTALSVEHARAAVRAAPDSAQGHVWLSVALGRQALREGPKTRLALSREIKSEVDRGLAIDPNIGRAYHVRAMWNRKISSLNWIERAAANMVLGGVPKGASMDNAVEDFEHAIQLEPDYVNHHLELGRTLMMLERYPEAKRELEKARSLPPSSSARDAKYQSEAAALLKQLPH